MFFLLEYGPFDPRYDMLVLITKWFIDKDLRVRERADQ